MTILLDAAQAVKSVGNVESITAMIVAISSLLSGLGLVQSKKTSSKVDVMSASMHDAEQNVKIEEIIKILTPMAAYITAVQYRQQLRAKIDDIGAAFISTNELGNDFQALILEGCAGAGQFFSNLHEIGFSEPIDKRLIMIKGRSLLRGLRSGVGGNVNFPNRIKDKIKLNVAENAISTLVAELELFQKSNYNGSTNKMYERLVLEWTRRFVADSIDVWRVEIKKP